MPTTTPSSGSSMSPSFRGIPSSIAESAPSFEAAVRTLRERDQDDLRRARRHHRRALEALKGGCYDALSDGTRERLVRRLTSDLEILNAALGYSSTRDTTTGHGVSVTSDTRRDVSPNGSRPSSDESTGSTWSGWLTALW